MIQLYLKHYGIRNMKWGNRRYQNEDGSLTDLGREHYGVGEKVRKSFDKAAPVLKKGADKGASTLHKGVDKGTEVVSKGVKVGTKTLEKGFVKGTEAFKNAPDTLAKKYTQRQIKKYDDYADSVMKLTNKEIERVVSKAEKNPSPKQVEKARKKIDRILSDPTGPMTYMAVSKSVNLPAHGSHRQAYLDNAAERINEQRLYNAILKKKYKDWSPS